MLHALLNNKLKEAFRCSSNHYCSDFTPSEDSKTSSVFGILQYLPGQTMWNLLRKSCGDSDLLEKTSGELEKILFWKGLKIEDGDGYNVYPDVILEFEKFNVIIEAKKDDNSGQNKPQWERQIKGYTTEYSGKKKKEMIYIALGGNASLRKKTIDKNKNEVYSASWYNLLNEVVNYNKNCINANEKRILSDVVLAFEEHDFFPIEWLETLPKEKEKISQESIIKINELWKTN